MKNLIVACIVAMVTGVVVSQVVKPESPPTASSLAKGQPVEIGKVRWNRDFDSAQALSKSSGKPMFVLFQEVPGCAGCQKFGREVLSNPLLVEAIENEFIPVVVFNNRSDGPDTMLLKRFNEPAWNYQVVRFLDSKAKDILPRKDKVWSTESLVARMTETLKKTKRPVPDYLTSLENTKTNKYSQAAFAMHCYWTGEYELGKLDGVVETEAGWLEGREVTLVKYDPARISLNKLATAAEKVKCAQKIYTPTGEKFGRLDAGKLDGSYRKAKESDQKYQLAQNKRFSRIPNLNATQRTKLNSLLPSDPQLAAKWLSPKQREWLKSAK